MIVLKTKFGMKLNSEQAIIHFKIIIIIIIHLYKSIKLRLNFADKLIPTGFSVQ